MQRGDHLPSQLPRRGYSSTIVDLGPVLHWQRPAEAFSGKLPRRRVKCTTGFTAARSQRSKEPRLVSAAILHTAHPNGHLDGQLRSDPAFVRRTEAGRTAVAAEASVCRVVLTAVACLSSLYATVVDHGLSGAVRCRPATKACNAHGVVLATSRRLSSHILLSPEWACKSPC